MGPFEQQVETLCEYEKVVVQRTAMGYVVRGWNRAGKPINQTVGTAEEAQQIKREIEAGKR